MNWVEIIKIYLSDKYSLNFEFGPIFLACIIIAIVLVITKFFKNKCYFKSDIVLNIKLGGIGSITIKPNYEVEQIAHKAWTELITRKAGLKFDLEHDVIIEIYNSWYVLFGEIRNLIKDIPANQVKDKNTRKLVNLLVDSLNNGLRPHLTKWQAKFRKWYGNEIEKHADETPQEAQKRYPLYNELISDLITINKQMVSYTDELKKIFS